MEETRRTNESRKRERLEKIGRIKSKAAFRCLHASRLNEDQSRARSSKQDDWPRVGLGYGRGAHDKNGATRRRRGWPLLFSHKCRVCRCTPNRPPRFTLPKNTVHLTPPPSRVPFFLTLAPSTLFRDWEARISRFNPRPGGYYATDRWMARGWFRDCQRARRRQIERFSRVSTRGVTSKDLVRSDCGWFWIPGSRNFSRMWDEQWD